MLHTIEAIIDEQGRIHWLENVEVRAPQRVLITLLDPVADETLTLAEPALADWLNNEEEIAWAHLQQEV